MAVWKYGNVDEVSRKYEVWRLYSAEVRVEEQITELARCIIDRKYNRSHEAINKEKTPVKVSNSV